MAVKAIVCFSGGHSSALAAIETVRRYGAENTILLNHDISSHVEHADIKRFKHEIADYCGIEITCANLEGFEHMPPLEVCRWKKAFNAGGGSGSALCTYYLKTKPFYTWLEANHPANKDTRIIYGFDENEQDRIFRRSDIIRSMGYAPEFPLANWTRTINATEDVGITRPITYRLYKHANCIGCLKAGRQHWYAVYCTRPDIFQEAKDAEAEIGYSIIKDAFLKDLEPKYQEMRDSKHICPSEKTDPATFWALVDSVLPDQTSMLPCDCSF